MSATGTEKLLVISLDSGAFTDETEAKIRAAFDDYTAVDFTADDALSQRLVGAASVVVAGGDGTIGFVARALSDSAVELGILSLGTYNNFSRALGLPQELDAAIEVIKHGSARATTLGMIGDHPFLETASIGLFGQAIELGETVKDRVITEFPARLRAVVGAKPFEYVLSGDLDGHGRARSLVFSNTPTSGTRMPVGETTPADDTLDLSVRVGASRSDVVGRMLASVFLDRHVDPEGMSFRFNTITVVTDPVMDVHADNATVARTPVTIQAHAGALRVIRP